MSMYQLKLAIKDNKFDEFLKCLHTLLGCFRQEEGCLDFSLYRDVERENTYIVGGEWTTREAMEKHFKGKHYSVLIGAAKVLGEEFQITIGDKEEKGGFKLAKEKIHLQSDMSEAVY